MRAWIGGPAPAARPGRRPPRRWSQRSVATSLAVSACWHLLVLAVLALAVHPFRIPDEQPPIEVQLIPRLLPEPEIKPPPTVPRLQPEDRPRAAPAIPTPSPPQVQPQPPTPLEAVRPATGALAKPLEVQSAPARSKPTLATQAPSINIQAPPEPLAILRPNEAALAKPLEVQRQAAPARSLSRQAPSVSVSQPAAERAPAPPAQVQVLTSDRVVQAPIEIKPAERRSAPALQTGTPAVPSIPLPGAAEASGAPPAAGGNGAGASGGSRADQAARDVIGGFDTGARSGMSLRLGCASPDTYRLSPEDRAACLRRLAEEAKSAADLGPNIPANKQAEYDRQAACHAATRGGGALPSSGGASDGTSIAGMGSNPTLRQCGPGDR